MGYKTEINYILKCSSESEGVNLLSKNVGETIVIQKSGNRTFVLNSPIMIADHNWNILGMCLITKTEVSKDSTILTAYLLTKLTPEESVLVSKIIQDGEKEKVKYL